MQLNPLQSRIEAYIQRTNWFEKPILNLIEARDKADSISKDIKQELLSSYDYEHDHYNYVILIESNKIDGSCGAFYTSPALSPDDFDIHLELIQDGFKFIFHVWGIKLV